MYEPMVYVAVGVSWSLLELWWGSSGPLGGSWKPLGSLLEASWSLLGTSGSHLGDLGCCWAHLGASWGALGASWEGLGKLWGASWERLGSILDVILCVWELFWRYFGAWEAYLKRLREALPCAGRFKAQALIQRVPPSHF